MKKFSKILSVALLVALVLSLGVASAFAASITITSTADEDTAQTDTTSYTWYRILEADIDTAPTQDGANQTGGKVAYYVTTAERAAEIEETGLFTVVRVGETNKWYVELSSDSTDAAAIAAAFGASTFNKTIFENNTFAQTAVGGTASATGLNPGYYYIESTAGTNVVIQTLTDVTINEKNTFPPVDKILDPNDLNAQIGDEINYTLKVEVPATANDFIVLTDTMSDGLTFKQIVSVKNNDATPADVSYVFAPEVAADGSVPAAVTTNGNKFTVTFSKDTVIANQGKIISVVYTAVLNNKAVVTDPENNTVYLDYGNHYKSVPKRVETETYSFSFDKVDGSNTEVKLTGAEFKLTTESGNTATSETGWINLIVVEAGKEYRVAMSEDTATPVDTIVTNGNTVTISGLDADVTYYLVETKVPTGYNGLAEPITVQATKDGENWAFAHQNVLNNKGSVLPSTGGIGTTIFYVVGGILVVAAGVLLVTKKRMSE